MARSNQRGGTASRRAPKDLGRRVKKKPCALCRDKTDWVDYKDIPMLRKYMSDRGKIRSRRVTGNCAQHQRALAQAIKTARELALLPYTQRTVTERPGGRRDRGERTLGDRDREERGGRDREERGGRGAPAPENVSVEVVDNTDALGDPATEAAVADEVTELVEELVEGAVADDINSRANANGDAGSGGGAPAGENGAGAQGGQGGQGGGA